MDANRVSIPTMCLISKINVNARLNVEARVERTSLFMQNLFMLISENHCIIKLALSILGLLM